MSLTYDEYNDKYILLGINIYKNLYLNITNDIVQIYFNCEKNYNFLNYYVPTYDVEIDSVEVSDNFSNGKFSAYEQVYKIFPEAKTYFETKRNQRLLNKPKVKDEDKMVEFMLNFFVSTMNFIKKNKRKEINL